MYLGEPWRKQIISSNHHTKQQPAELAFVIDKKSILLAIRNHASNRYVYGDIRMHVLYSIQMPTLVL